MLAHQQTLQEIGHTLLAKRLERGLTLEDVAAAINVRTFFLSCMENGQFEKLPGGIYTIGLAKLYIVWLGFDDRQCQDWLNQLLNKPIEDEKKNPVVERPVFKISLPIGISIAAVVLFVSLLVISRKNQEKGSEAASAFIMEPSSSATEVTNDSKTTLSSTLALYMRGTTWIKITDTDGNILHTQLAKKGATIDLTPHIGKNLTVGDGRQVVIYHDGAEVGPLVERSDDDNPVLIENTPIRIEQ